MQANKERAQREQDQYNTGLQRETYDRVLSHCGYFWDFENQDIFSLLDIDIEDKKILELGSNSWFKMLDSQEKKPKSIDCINISERELERGIEQAKKSKLSPNFHLMDANSLDFDDNSFDIVFGTGILHHLDLELSVPEVKRVLKPSGVCVFNEPLNVNPVGKIVRHLTPKARTIDEKPFTHEELNFLQSQLSCDFHYQQFLSVPCGVVSGLVIKNPENSLTKFGYKMDQWIINKFPSFGPYFRHVWVKGRKV